MSNSGKMDDEIERPDYFSQIEGFVFEPEANRSQFGMGDRYRLLMDCGPNLGVTGVL